MTCHNYRPEVYFIFPASIDHGSQQTYATTLVLALLRICLRSTEVVWQSMYITLSEFDLWLCTQKTTTTTTTTSIQENISLNY